MTLLFEKHSPTKVLNFVETLLENLVEKVLNLNFIDRKLVDQLKEILNVNWNSLIDSIFYRQKHKFIEIIIVNLENQVRLITSATRQMRRLVVFGRRLSARFPCPTGQEIARNPHLRVASYVSGQFIAP